MEVMDATMIMFFVVQLVVPTTVDENKNVHHKSMPDQGLSQNSVSI